MTVTSPEEVTERIDDWVNRLNSLYDKVDEWLESIPHDRVKRQSFKQVVEPPLKRFKIARRDIPMYTIFKGKRRVAFVPSVLWALGANGRINVATIAREHILVDRGDEKIGSKWELVVDDFKRLLVPFTKAQLVRLLEEGE